MSFCPQGIVCSVFLASQGHDRRLSVFQRTHFSIFNNKIMGSRFLWGDWKPLFEVNFSKNSTKTIRLFTLDFYDIEAIVDSAFGLINYHLLV